MRRGLFVVLASLAAGCAQGVDDDADDLAISPVVALSAPGHLPAMVSSQPPAELARATTGLSFAATKPFVLVACKKNAFCDDFEGAVPGSRWSGAVARDGVIDFDAPSSSLGAHALRAASAGAGSVAYLTLDGAPLGTQWVGSLGFSMRLDGVPAEALGGPELAVVGANGASTRIGFSVRPEGIALHQYAAGCSGGACASRSDLVADTKAGEWRRLVLAVETSNAVAAPYGRVEVTVDGGELVTLPLVVAPFSGRAVVRAGITAGDSAPATARIDDVVFYAH